MTTPAHAILVSRPMAQWDGFRLVSRASRAEGSISWQGPRDANNSPGGLWLRQDSGGACCLGEATGTPYHHNDHDGSVMATGARQTHGQGAKRTCSAHAKDLLLGAFSPPLDDCPAVLN